MTDPKLLVALCTADAVGLLLGGWWCARARPASGSRERVYAVLGIVLVMSVFTAIGWPWRGFAVLRAWCHGLFCVLLPLVAVRALRLYPRWPRVSVLLLLGALMGEACYFWARRVEPFRLEVTHERITSSRLAGLERPVRVVAVADLQPDEIGAHEIAMFDRIVALEPDLVVFLGDTLLSYGPYFSLQQPLLLAQLARLSPRLGMFAVDGDVDADAARQVFAGSQVAVLMDSHAELPGVPIDVIGLSRARSRRHQLDAGLLRRLAGERFPLVIGHAPDYMRAVLERRVAVDGLLLAGHTHGGQVQVPGFGPLITLSSVPRWLAGGGVFQVGKSWLAVSRGVGMERDDAPRIRFWCRPQLLVLDLAAGD